MANTIKGLIRCYWEVYLILDCSNQSPVPGGQQVQCTFRPYLFEAEHDYWFLENYYALAVTPAVTTRYPITPFKSSYMWCIILVGCIWGGEVKLPTPAAWIQRLQHHAQLQSSLCTLLNLLFHTINKNGHVAEQGRVKMDARIIHI